MIREDINQRVMGILSSQELTDAHRTLDDQPVKVDAFKLLGNRLDADTLNWIVEEGIREEVIETLLLASMANELGIDFPRQDGFARNFARLNTEVISRVYREEIFNTPVVDWNYSEVNEYDQFIGYDHFTRSMAQVVSTLIGNTGIDPKSINSYGDMILLASVGRFFKAGMVFENEGEIRSEALGIIGDSSLPLEKLIKMNFLFTRDPELQEIMKDRYKKLYGSESSSSKTSYSTNPNIRLREILLGAYDSQKHVSEGDDLAFRNLHYMLGINPLSVYSGSTDDLKKAALADLSNFEQFGVNHPVDRNSSLDKVVRHLIGSVYEASIKAGNAIDGEEHRPTQDDRTLGGLVMDLLNRSDELDELLPSPLTGVLTELGEELLGSDAIIGGYSEGGIALIGDPGENLDDLVRRTSASLDSANRNNLPEHNVQPEVDLLMDVFSNDTYLIERATSPQDLKYGLAVSGIRSEVGFEKNVIANRLSGDQAFRDAFIDSIFIGMNYYSRKILDN